MVKKLSSAAGGADRPEAARLGVQEAVERLELLTMVSSALSQAMDDYTAALGEVAEACVPGFCDLCAVELAGDGGEWRTVAYRVAPDAGLDAPREWGPVADGAAERSPLLSWDHSGESDAIRRIREGVRAESLIIAPVTGGGLTLGWLVLATGPGRRGMRPSALRIADDIAKRIATCVQRVLLYRESVSAAQQQAQAARRLRRLAAAAANLAGATTPEEVLRTACVEICIVLDADAAAATWRPHGSAPFTASVGAAGSPDADDALGAAVEGGGAPEGWIASPLPCSDPRDRGALAVFSAREMTDDDELLLTSLSSMVPVAFERALHTEKALLREAELAAVLEASPVAIVTVEADGSVASANRAAHALFGWDDTENQPRFPAALRQALRKLPAEVRRSGPVTNRAVVGDGFDLSVSAAPMPASADDVPSILVVANDVREQREVERALLQAQRLEAMGQVAGGVAHDFNNLLTIIVGYSSILRRQLQDPAAGSILDHIDTAVGRASSLTQQLLGFTRRQMDDVVVLDLVNAVREVSGVLERLFGPTVTLDLRLPSVGIAVAADPSAVEQTILNLCLNARDALEDGGKVTLAVDDIDIGESAAEAVGVAPGTYARLVVEDDGPGMESHVKERCLEPFFTTKERGHGTGLGLPTVYGYTVERGGALIIESAPGDGTRVTVLLPRAVPVDDPAPSAGAAAVPALSGRALLVEDQDELRALARLVLTEAGMEVVEAADAETALAGLDAEGPWDVLVTDIVLSGMSGVDLSMRLRALQPDLPVLYVSGYADHDSRRRGVVDGARLLHKPYRPEDLCQRVAELLAATDA